MADKPNIIFLHVDQLKWSAIGVNGCDQVATPNLDRLLSDAVRFDRSYCAAPICVPARTAWYTGLEPEQSGITENAQLIKNPEQVTDVATWLRDRAGYDCYYMGKWHIALKESACGFQRLCGSNHIGEYGDTAVARAAEAFLSNRKEDKPFFLNVGLLNPHDICYWSFPVSPAKFSLAEKMKDQLPALPPNFSRKNAGEGWSDLQWRFYAYSYFRFVEMVDEEIGRIYRAFLHSPQRENTVFIFSADHGQANGEHGHTTKGQPYEHSLRVPLAIIDPRAAAPRCDTTHLVSGLDMAPTLCDYAGVESMPRNNGQSFKPLVRTMQTGWRDWLAASTPRLKHRIILKDGFKLIYDRSRRSSALFDLKNDPWEMKDLSKNPEQATVLSELMALRETYDASREICPMAQKDLNRYL